MELTLDSQLINLVSSLEKDLTKVIHEALALWLKERLTVCPITKQNNSIRLPMDHATIAT